MFNDTNRHTVSLRQLSFLSHNIEYSISYNTTYRVVALTCTLASTYFSVFNCCNNCSTDLDQSPVYRQRKLLLTGIYLLVQLTPHPAIKSRQNCTWVTWLYCNSVPTFSGTIYVISGRTGEPRNSNMGRHEPIFFLFPLLSLLRPLKSN